MRWQTIPPTIIIDNKICINCLKCVKSCPAEILIQETLKTNVKKSNITILEPNLCFECRACEVVCPVNAIKVMCTIKKQIKDINTTT